MNVEDKIKSFCAKLMPSDKIQLAIAFGTLATVVIFAYQTSILNSQTSEVIRQVEILSNQTSIMQQDFDVNNRQWIGVTRVQVIDDYVEYDLKNFGTIPYTSGETITLVRTNPIVRYDLNSNSFKADFAQIMPTQEITNNLKIDRMDLLHGAVEGNNTMFVGILINYQYGDKKIGHYGYIAQYDKEIKDFNIIDTWSG